LSAARQQLRVVKPNRAHWPTLERWQTVSGDAGWTDQQRAAQLNQKVRPHCMTALIAEAARQPRAI